MLVKVLLVHVSFVCVGIVRICRPCKHLQSLRDPKQRLTRIDVQRLTRIDVHQELPAPRALEAPRGSLAPLATSVRLVRTERLAKQEWDPRRRGLSRKLAPERGVHSSSRLGSARSWVSETISEATASRFVKTATLCQALCW